ncbi:MAG: tRNA dihydrouridine synthase DusB [Gammaproteobacteria bacterium]|nr:tRNA dihydrouridine synthase DusB [Gammaproteobacteria bacterium]
MQIGNYTLKNNLILAPMAGVTDRPFRQLCRRFGAGLAVSEMTSANALLWNSKKTLQRIDFQGEEAPCSVQIAGGEPEMMAAAARFNAEHGAQIIDINMGCPAKKVCNKQAGSALLQNEPLVEEIIQAVVKAVNIPVTLKIRTGWDQEHRNALTIARIAEQNGIQALAIHGRTRADAYRGEAEYDTIAAIKQAISIPVIANGDIRSPEDAKKVLEKTQADALMIGRAAQGRPWIFAEIEHFLKTGQILAPRSDAEISAIFVEHLQQLYAFYGEHQGVRVARKHISWYCKHKPDSAAFRKNIYKIEESQCQIEQVKHFFSEPTRNPQVAA